ncbi:MAG TPA: transport-associated protein [Elusimicrobia bacterium]|nr:transport-associated protein [Elusimicrobiota bacterium]
MKVSHLIIAAAAALFALGGPAFAAKLDVRIVDAARNSYVFRTYLAGDDIKISSKDGVVTLTGGVAEVSRKSLAQETVANLPGVRHVINELEVTGAPTPSSDAWLSDKLKITLLFRRGARESRTEVEVKDGIATLRGRAESQAQKDLVTGYAQDIEGISEVRNEMVVAPAPENPRGSVGEKIDDASITAQVKLALLLHRSTGAVRASVATKRGVVTLSGKAGSTAEIDLVGKIAEDVNGVKRVRNLMTLD